MKYKSLKDEEKEVQVKIFDTSGQERFRNLTQSFYRSADGVILVFDVEKAKTFASIEMWIEEVNKVHAENIPKILVGNK